MLQAIKNYFSNSGTLMLGAATMIGGAASAGFAAAMQADLINTAFSSNFNWKVVLTAGITAFVQGAVTYVTRTSGTATVEIAGNPHLAPVVAGNAKPVATDGKAVVVKK